MRAATISFSDNCMNAELNLEHTGQYLDSLHGMLKQGLSASQRLDCIIKLRQYLLELKKHYPDYFPFPKDIAELLITISKELCDWPLLLTLHSNQVVVDSVLSQAEAHFYMGDSYAARRCLEKELLADPYNQSLHRCWCYVKGRPIEYHQLLQDEEIYLTPLQDHHMQAFSWQYSTPVKNLCNLPDIDNSKEWQAWYDTTINDPYRAIFAVIHQQWGFIGCVNLQVYEGIGFFYYWLGEDFQGQGFGPRAVSCLLDYGYHYMRMDCCYAKVYECNTHSHKAIQKLGFSILPFSALPPYEDEVFYYCGEAKPQAVLFNDIQYLFYKMDSLMQIVPNRLEVSYC